MDLVAQVRRRATYHRNAVDYFPAFIHRPGLIIMIRIFSLFRKKRPMSTFSQLSVLFFIIDANNLFKQEEMGRSPVFLRIEI